MPVKGQVRRPNRGEVEIKVVSELVPRRVHEVKSSYEKDEWIEELKNKLEDGSGKLIPHHLAEYQ